MANVANLTTILAAESASFLSAIEQSRGGLKSLIASLDPAAAATDRFNKQSALLENGLKRGVLTADQYSTAMQRLTARHQEASRGQLALTTTSGQTRAGMQQLSFQLGDIATQYASGTKAMVIFAQQSGQVIQALTMMTTKTSGLLGFLGGPWGQIITAAVIVLTPFIAKLFEAGDAAGDLETRLKLAADGADAFGDAQSLLGRLVDLTTGKLKSQNDVLRAAIRLQAILSLEQGKKGIDDARKAIGDRANVMVGGFGSITPGGTGIGQATERRFVSPEARDVAQALLAGKIGTEQALKNLDALQKSGKAAKEVVRDLSTQFVEFGQSRERVSASQKVLDFLDGKGLDPALVPYSREKRPRKGPSDRSDQREERFDIQMAQLQAERLTLLGRITTDLRTRAGLEHDALEADLAAFREQIAHQVKQKEITAERAKELLAAKDANLERQRTLINWQLDDDLLREHLQLDQSALDNRRDMLSAQLEEARTAEDRRRIGLELLDIDYERQRLGLDLIRSLHSSTDAEKQIAEKRLTALGGLQRSEVDRVNRTSLNPIAAFADQIPRTAAEINEALENVAVDGLKSLNDGLADAIANSKSLGEVFTRVANQVIADILRIVIQQQLIKPLSGLLEGGGGGLASLFSGGGGAGSLQGMANGMNGMGALPGFANGGSFAVGGFPGIDRNVLSINGIPRAMVSGDERIRVDAANDRGGSGRGNVTIYANDAVLASTVRQWVAEGMLAAERGAVATTERREQRRATRQLGRTR